MGAAPGVYFLNVTLEDEEGLFQPSGVAAFRFIVEGSSGTTAQTTIAAPLTTTASPLSTTAAVVSTAPTVPISTAAIASTAPTVPTSAAASASTTPAEATTQEIRVVHAIPNLTVDVYVNGALTLAGFSYGVIHGPLNLAPGNYLVEIRAAGSFSSSASVLQSQVNVSPRLSADIVAYVNLAGAPVLGVFANPGSSLSNTNCIAEGQGRLIVRHASSVGPVSLSVRGSTIISQLENGFQASAVVPSGTHQASVNNAAPVYVPVNDRYLRILYLSSVGMLSYETKSCQVCDLRVHVSHITPASAETRSLVELSVVGGIRPYSYLWSWNSTTTSELRDAPGLDFSPYVATVTDSKNCSRNVSVIVPFEGPESFISIDTRTKVFSGTYANLDNPNFLSLTWLLGHGDHYHPKAAKAYTGPANGTSTRVGRNGSVLPESGRLAMISGSGVYESTFRSPAASFLRIRNLDTLRINQDVLFRVTRYPSQFEQFVPPAANASFFLRLTGLSGPEVRVGSETTRSIGLNFVGSEIELPQGSIDLVIWLSGTATSTASNYSATFQLVDKSLPQRVSESGNVTILLAIQDCSRFSPRISRVVPASLSSKARVELNVTGGTPPYSFRWNTGHTGKDLIDVPSLGERIYSVLVSDSRNCSQTLTTVVDWTGPESFVAMDGRAVIPTGAFAGRANPNFNNLVWAIGHGDHYHGKAALSFAANGTIVRSANFLPESGRILMKAGDGLYSNRLRSEENSYLHLRSVHELAPNQRVLYTSSGRRFSQAFGVRQAAPTLLRQETLSSTSGAFGGSDGDSILSPQINDGAEILWAGSTQREGRIYRDGRINIANLVRDFPVIDTRQPRLASGSDHAVWVATTDVVPSLGYQVDRVYLQRPSQSEIPSIIAQVQFGSPMGFALTNPVVNDLGEAAMIRLRYSNFSRSLLFHDDSGVLSGTRDLLSEWSMIEQLFITNERTVAFKGRRLASDPAQFWVFDIGSSRLTVWAHANAIASGSLRGFGGNSMLVFNGTSSAGSFYLVNASAISVILTAGQGGLASLEGGWLNEHGYVLFTNRVEVATSNFSGSSDLWLRIPSDGSITQISRNTAGEAISAASISGNLRVIYTTTVRLLPSGSRVSMYSWSSVDRPVHLVLVDRSPSVRVGSPSALSIGLERPGDQLLLPSLSVDLVFWANSLAPGNYSITFRLEDAFASSTRLTNSRLPASGDIVFLLQVPGSSAAPILPNLVVYKDDCVPAVNIGGSYEFKVTVQNDGSLATGVVLEDRWPSAYILTSVPAGCSLPSLGIITCSLGNLQAGARITIAFPYRVSATSAVVITNTVTVTSTNGDSDFSTNEASDTNLIQCSSVYGSICANANGCCSPLVCLRHVEACNATQVEQYRCAIRGGSSLRT